MASKLATLVPSEERFKVVTANLPIPCIDRIQYLVDKGYIASRSEFLRIAILQTLSSIELIDAVCHPKPIEKVEPSIQIPIDVPNTITIDGKLMHIRPTGGN